MANRIIENSALLIRWHLVAGVGWPNGNAYFTFDMDQQMD